MTYLVGSVGLVIVGLHTTFTAWQGRDPSRARGLWMNLTLVYLTAALNGVVFLGGTLLVFSSDSTAQLVVNLVIALSCAAAGSFVTARAIQQFSVRHYS